MKQGKNSMYKGFIERDSIKEIYQVYDVESISKNEIILSELVPSFIKFV